MISSYDYLIIGGGITGVTAAETVREYSSEATIGILCEEPHLLYSRVLLPAYLKKRVPREKLFLRAIDDFTERRIDLRVEERVMFIDPVEKVVRLENQAALSYRKLLIAAGGRVRSWGIRGEERFTYRLQTLDDADRLLDALHRISYPLIVGSSFISLEFIEIFLANRILPKVVIRNTHFFSPFLDAAGGELMKSNFAKHGVTVMPKDYIIKTSPREKVIEVETALSQTMQCDALAMGIGIERNVEFLKGSGVALGEHGVRTNEFLETNLENVYAAGDIAEFYDPIFGKHHIMGNWTNAFLQGKRAGLNMVGRREPFRNVSGYSITNLGVQITVLGDCSDGEGAITRISHDPRTFHYERFFLREEVLVGAVLMNQFQDKTHLAALIDAKAPIEGYRKHLEDFAFDIHNIPVVR